VRNRPSNRHGDHICHRLIQNQVNILAVSFISEENQMTCINPSICHLQIPQPRQTQQYNSGNDD
jgi:hypothetical protein